MKTFEIRATLQKITSDLVGFAKLERIIAAICIFIPLFLAWADNWQIRESISDYVYMSNSHIFGLLLTMAAMLFIVNGAIYIQTERLRDCKKQGRWYNIILGISLLGVILLPHKEYGPLHFIFASIFFAGSALVIALFNDRKHRKTSLVIAIFSISGLLIYVVNNHVFAIPWTEWLTLFWAEWISLAVIAIHYILESLGELT